MHSDKLLLNTSVFGIILLFWGLVSVFGNFSSVVLPSPIDVVRELGVFLTDMDSLMSVSYTLFRILVALIVSSFIGIGLGILFGYYRILDESTELIIDFIRSTPSITLLPLFIMFFGINDFSRLMVCFTIAIPLIIVNTKYGVVNSIKTRQKLAKLYNIPEEEILTRITLPEASPYIFTGIRIAISLIIILIIVSEMLVGQEYGIGQIIIDSQYTFDTARMLSAIIVIGTIGFLTNMAFNKLERRIFHWR